MKESWIPDGLFRLKEEAPHIVAAGCHHHEESKADVNAQGLSYGEQGIRYLGVASTDSEGTRVFCGNMTFSEPPRTGTKTSSPELETWHPGEDDLGRPRCEYEGNEWRDWYEGGKSNFSFARSGCQIFCVLLVRICAKQEQLGR